jgi:predicted acetyltransferase
MEITVERPSRSDRDLIRRMMELYLHDFSEFDDSDLDEHGVFGYGDLDYFWFEKTHAAFIVRVDGHLGGFVLIDNEVMIDGNQQSISEFFVLRKYRRQGVGRKVAKWVFDEMPGKWEIRVIAANVPAQAFWREAISEYTGGRFDERAMADDDWTGPVFWFESHPG